jgi:biotin-dependent carboxylase-like uncharacterized protein
VTPALRIERAGHAVVQDLGRPGHGGIGVAVNGAIDQHAAQVANLLTGNGPGAALVEITGSDLAVRATSDVLVAVTGAAREVLVDGARVGSWEALPLAAGSSLVVPVPEIGYRSYLAVNGELDAPRVLGSVAPDRLLEFGTRLAVGDELSLSSRYAPSPDDLSGLFRLGAAPTSLRSPMRVPVTSGPELDHLVLGAAALDQALTLRPQSDEVGLRFDGDPLERNRTEEILSRGVPLGAVEVVPDGSLLVLMRGRLVTAGYPVVAVTTTTGLDLLGQLRPGDQARLELVDVAEALAAVRARAADRDALAARVRAAFTARGLGAALYPA